MLQINQTITPADLVLQIENFWRLSGEKIRQIEAEYDHSQGSPVFTVGGRYTTRGWTEWTQGFEFGSAILQFDATGDDWFLDYGRTNTVGKMAPHLSHFGVHDHGFNNVSTYGNLLRLLREGRLAAAPWEENFYQLALKVSGASQARRWTTIPEGGFIYSFNGPHSLFVDTIRSCRALAISHALGHRYMDEGDREISLLGRIIDHARATATFSVYYGEGRDHYDTQPGRTTHEAIFNTNDGQFRCPNAQQGFSGFTTWTRGLAWAMLGFSEQLEFFATLADEALAPFGGREDIEGTFLEAARATCDFYLANTPTDGIPYWDTGAPDLHHLGGGYLDRAADPFNDYEPVDSSAATIACQGLIRLGRYLGEAGSDYLQAGLTVLKSLLSEPYLSTDASHQGLILHSIYHQPNGWDHIPEGSKIASGESSMWGDYHAREAAILVQRIAAGQDYHFYDCI